jgi:hypothetical protein
METPNKGQPIDYSYLRRMADAITALETNAKTVSAKSSILTSSDKSASDASPNDLVIVTRYVTMQLPANNVTSPTPGKVDFGNKFIATPVVTATPIATSTTNDPEKVTIAISSVSQNEVQIVGVSTDGKAREIGVNIIAIGYKKS